MIQEDEHKIGTRQCRIKKLMISPEKIKPSKERGTACPPMIDKSTS
jgi:hypothetical protein